MIYRHCPQIIFFFFIVSCVTLLQKVILWPEHCWNMQRKVANVELTSHLHHFTYRPPWTSLLWRTIWSSSLRTMPSPCLTRPRWLTPVTTLSRSATMSSGSVSRPKRLVSRSSPGSPPVRYSLFLYYNIHTAHDITQSSLSAIGILGSHPIRDFLFFFPRLCPKTK